MLLHLHVKNLALIEDAEVDFGPGLNILSGETGAGKSILLGSIQLVLGSRFSRSLVRAGASQALVELLFQVEDAHTLAALAALDILPEEGQILLRRRMVDGKSICQVNGQVCTMNRLKDAAACLLDIHGQHEHQSLVSSDRQLQILDEYGKETIAPFQEQTAQAYQAYRDCLSRLKSLDLDEDKRKREMAFLEFEISEIEAAGLILSEDEDLERRFRRMSNSQRIENALARTRTLTGAEGAADKLGEACRHLREAAALEKSLEPLLHSLEDADALLADLNRDLDAFLDDLSFEEEEYAKVSRRLDLINSLKTRYGRSIEDILAYQAKQQESLIRLERHEELLAKARQDQQEARKALDHACHALSQARQEAAAGFETQVAEGLRDLGFLDVRFFVRFAKTKSYTSGGFDQVTYDISTNPGEEPKPLAEVASGGELSRIMLAIKALLADKDHMETLVFDEIDTGISGRTAQKVSQKMALIGRHHQVLCITHLPQIAAMADVHFEIEKTVQDAQTTTQIHRLEEEDSIRELARLLSGASLTEAVLENAAEMKHLAQAFKKGKTEPEEPSS